MVIKKYYNLDIGQVHITWEIDFIMVKNTVTFKKENDIPIITKIWDSSGLERFQHLTTNAIKNTRGIFLVYDITIRHTFYDLNKWIDIIKKCQDISQYPIVIIGNKNDLEAKRQVSKEEAQKFADTYHFPYFEASALTGKGVMEAFSALIEKVYERTLTEKQ